MNPTVLLFAPLLRVIVSTATFPNDLGAKHLCAEYPIHEEFEVVTCGGVAVEVDGAGFFEDAAQLDEAWGHHGEVGEHVGAAEEGTEGAHGVGYAATLFDDFFVAAGGFFVPLPGVFEGGDLGGGAGAVFFGEEDVVVLAGVERRIEVDEVYGLVRDVLAQNLEVVTVVKLVLFCGHPA